MTVREKYEPPGLVEPLTDRLEELSEIETVYMAKGLARARFPSELLRGRLLAGHDGGWLFGARAA
jgi:hypothetical protein